MQRTVRRPLWASWGTRRVNMGAEELDADIGEGAEVLVAQALRFFYSGSTFYQPPITPLVVPVMDRWPGTSGWANVERQMIDLGLGGGLTRNAPLVEVALNQLPMVDASVPMSSLMDFLTEQEQRAARSRCCGLSTEPI
jgi:hypothetical protein